MLAQLNQNKSYKKGVLDSQPQVKLTSFLPVVGGSLRILRLPPTKTGRRDIAESGIKTQ